MDLISIGLYLLGTIVVLLLAYTYYMSKDHGLHKKLGIPTPTIWPLFGTMFTESKSGMFQYHVEAYRKYRGHKAYGGFFGRLPVIYPRDLDIVRDICVKHFHQFPNRISFEIEEPLNHAMVNLKDDHWKRVRNIVTPSFSSGKLKRMDPQLQNKAKNLVNFLKEKMESGEPVELRDTLSRYSLDCIAANGFGAEINSFTDKDNRVAIEAKKLIKGANDAGLVGIFCDFLWPLVKRLTTFVPTESINFFKAFVDQVMEERKSEGASRRTDFLQLVMEAQQEEEAQEGGDPKKALTYLDLQGQALIFILGGYDTVSTAMSFTAYLLALHPECCQKVHDEIDTELKGAEPTSENIHQLTYLDQCINEAIRLYPPGFLLDRVCNEDIEIHGVTFPKGVMVFIPACGIHNDPELYPEPEKFRPERFTAEEKAKRHPYAFLPFGMGPRNCVGMRLALMTLKIGLASMFQSVTPVRCEKTVYPIRLHPFLVLAKDGIWVKIEPRKKT